MIFRIFKTLLYLLIRKSDVRFWTTHHDTSESGRTNVISKYIKSGESVLEFGAGDSSLKNVLPPDCSYTPSDIVSRTIETYICDLNQKPHPVFPKHDVAVCSEVLEYVHDLDDLFKSFSKSFARLIISYADVDRNPGLGQRISKGWFNHFTRRKLLSKLEHAGYRLDQEAAWYEHGIYVLTLRK